VPQSLAALRLPRELREQLHLHCAQERLRGPEAEADLHDLIWCRIVTHVQPSSGIEQARSRQRALSSQTGARETWPGPLFRMTIPEHWPRPRSDCLMVYAAARTR